MKKWLPMMLLLVLTCPLLLPAFAKAPTPLADVAPIGDLAADAAETVGVLEGLLSNADDFAGEESKIKQAAGVLACLGQALAEHAEGKQVQIAGPSLRAAALSIRSGKSHADAASGLAEAKAALAGEASSRASAEHPWNKLIGMHAMMEEFNARNSKLRRALRRLRRPEEESRLASTQAVLALAMLADTHEVKNEADIPQWQAMARDYQQTMTKLAAAMKAEDRDLATDLFAKATSSCTACHGKFRDAEE